eukprot:426856-Amphidinium_carterae.3
MYTIRTGDPVKQKVTGIHLRAGLRGVAYSAVKHLTHEQLMTTDKDGDPTIAGVELMLRELQAAVGREKPLRAQKRFDQAFFSKAAYRAQGESMQAYMVRRRRELEELTAVSPDASISRDLQAQLLLRFAGLNMKDKSQVLASTNNVWDMDKIEQALRTQFADIH